MYKKNIFEINSLENELSNNIEINKINVKGEIVFSGQNVSLGYAKSLNDLKKDDENENILYTGDLAIRDKDNFLYIVGRKNRNIKLFGKRINLDDIENFFKSKGMKAKCKYSNSKIILNLPASSDAGTEIYSLSKFLGINRNFIIVDKNFSRSFKDY